MTAVEKYKQEEFKRLIFWMKANKSDWNRLFGSTKSSPKMEHHLEALKNLYDNSFYDLFFAYIMRNIGKEPIKDITVEIFLNKLTDNWSDGIVMQVAEEIIEKLTDRIAKKQNAQNRMLEHYSLDLV